MLTQPLMQREEVLRYIDSLQFRTQYIKIIVLDNMDCPLRAIEGRATGGSININGSSSMRRSGSLTLVTEYQQYTEHPFDIMHEVTNIETLISMNKRIQVQLGIENTGDQFIDEKIFWIPLGVFLIQNASVTYNNTGITIQLKLVDKMALLNGEMGGTFSCDIVHAPTGSYTTNDYGKESIVNEMVQTYTLIETLVRDYGELYPFEYVIDVPATIKNLIRWTGKDDQGSTYGLLIDDLNHNLSITTDGTGFQPGTVIGYTVTDFVYPIETGKTLESKAGESVTSVLDKIKNTLGNYEYFFDINGIFHFQEIKNFLNEGSKIDNLMQAIADKYFLNVEASTKAIYRFDSANLITSYSNNPQYNQIKNDFSIWGKRGKSETPIQYHLVFQDAPDEYSEQYWVVSTNGNIITTAQSVVEAPIGNGFDIGKFISGPASQKIYYINFTAAYRPKRMSDTGATMEWTIDDDWRLKLFLKTFEANKQLTPFDKELQVKMPTLYALGVDALEWSRSHPEGDDPNKEFFAPIYSRNELVYWLDIINTNDIQLQNTVDITQFGIETIGRRMKVLSDDKVNCLFYSHDETVDTKMFVEKANGNGWNEITQQWELDATYTVNNELPDGYTFWDMVSLGVTENPAYDLLRSSLHEYLSYSNNINLTTIPVYYLDANQRISVNSPESDIHGDYVINTISLPLALNGMMTINARKAVERI